MSEWGKEEKPKKVSRRDFLVGAGAGATGLVVGGLVGREAFPKEVQVEVPGQAPSEGPSTAPTSAPQQEATSTELAKAGKIVWDQEKCAACSRCLMTCAVYHHSAVAPILSAVKWQENDTLPGYGLQKPIYCNQCDHPECYYACPLADKGAIAIDEKTGARYINPDVCTGCGECFDACPFDPPRIQLDTANDVAFKCDLCKDNADGPVCVGVCDRKALTFVPREEA